MAEHGNPSVYVVDSHVTQPPVPPRPIQNQRRVGAAQTILFLLIGVALCGMTIEACFIYYLYHPGSATSALSKQIGGEDSPTESPSYDILPSKPAAHLTDGHGVVNGQPVLAWVLGAHLLYEMDYINSSLIIQNEGYYYVYSKVYFKDSGVFHHYVIMRTERYPGGSIKLLQARKYSPKSSTMRSNSYLGGVFHLYKDAAIYVKVNNITKIDRHAPQENVFGAYMI